METLEISRELDGVVTKEATVVAMSGGVDSSVAAAMMTSSQSNVIGITLKLYDEKKIAKSKTCCAGSDILDAKRIASTCLLYTSPSPRDLSTSRMPSSA